MNHGDQGSLAEAEPLIELLAICRFELGRFFFYLSGDRDHGVTVGNHPSDCGRHTLGVSFILGNVL